MPARPPTRRDTTAGAGFGGFTPTPNPFTRQGAGAILTSDVEQAAGSLGLGATPAPTSTPRPSATPTPRPTATPPIRMDPSGAGYASSTLNHSEWGESLKRPRMATGGGVDPQATIIEAGPEVTRAIPPRVAGNPPPLIDDPNADWTGAEPTVAGPPAAGPVVYPPSLDDWNNRNGLAGNTRSGFGDLTLGQFLSTPLAMLRLAGTTPAGQSPVGQGQVIVGNASGLSSADPSGGGRSPAPETDAVTGWSPSPEEQAGADETFRQAEERGRRESTGVENTTLGAIVPGPVTPMFGNLSSPGGAPVYSLGGNQWRPVAGAPVDIRWNPNSGTGNFQASEFTKSWEAGGQNVGGTNDTGTTTDRGLDTFYNRMGVKRRYNPETEQFETVAVDTGPEAQRRASASRELYQAALRAVPMDPKTGYTVEYIKKLNEWVLQHGKRETTGGGG